nr:zinc finger protein MAGPIE-like [Ipomoea batatas]
MKKNIAIGAYMSRDGRAGTSKVEERVGVRWGRERIFYPEAEVIALSPKTLMATNRFLCEICGKGFQRDQNLQLHRRGHNLPWKLKQRSSKEVRKRVYVCPEKSCVHHHPSRALGDLTGIKKHYCRKHGEKKWKCEKCSKRYAVQSDWKAHSKTCGTREYRCDCGTVFSRKDSFITHRAFCDALAEETARVTAASNMQNAAAVAALGSNINYHFIGAAAPAIGPGMAAPPHFGSIFKPTIIGNDENMNPVRQGQLPLWMAAAPGQTTTSSQGQEFQSFVGSENPMVTTPLSSSGSFQLNWNNLVGNNKISTTSNSNSTNNNNGEEMDGNHQSQVMSVPIPSLFSTQHRPHHHHQTPSANMSATALLQKAAQIGATTSDPAFLGSLGLQAGFKYLSHCQWLLGIEDQMRIKLRMKNFSCLLQMMKANNMKLGTLSIPLNIPTHSARMN